MTPAEALQKALRGEHAALYLYGVLGAQASQSRQPELFARLEEGYDAHRAARDELTELVNAKGLDPAPAEVSYELPGPTDTATQIEGVARTIETRLTATYGELVASTSGADRRWAIRALDASALRELALGAPARHFPGLE